SERHIHTKRATQFCAGKAKGPREQTNEAESFINQTFAHFEQGKVTDERANHRIKRRREIRNAEQLIHFCRYPIGQRKMVVVIVKEVGIHPEVKIVARLKNIFCNGAVPDDIDVSADFPFLNENKNKRN